MSRFRVAGFVLKLHTILQESNYSHIVCWSVDDVQIKNQSAFVEEVLPKFFRHQRIESFVRQLNLYGFRKVSKTDKHSIFFRHQHFKKGQPNLLPLVQLKVKAPEGESENNSVVAREQAQNSQAILQHNQLQFQQTLSHVQSRLKRAFRDHPALEPELKEAMELIRLCNTREELGFVPSSNNLQERKSTQRLLGFDSRLSI